MNRAISPKIKGEDSNSASRIHDSSRASCIKVRAAVIACLCFILFSAPTMAAPLLFHLWSEEQPAPTPSPFLSWTDDQPDQTDGVHSWRVTDPTLTLYLPEQPCGQAILCCPGGGYWDVWHGTEGHNLAEWLNEQGVALAVLTYRLPAGVKEIPLEDVHRAMRLMREHQREWQIQEIGIMGFSAGGHLAATAATRWNSPEERPDFQVLFYPVITMDESFTHMGSRINLLGDHPSQHDILLYSCEKQVTNQSPRAFIVASSDDGLVPVKTASAITAPFSTTASAPHSSSIPRAGMGGAHTSISATASNGWPSLNIGSAPPDKQLPIFAKSATPDR